MQTSIRNYNIVLKKKGLSVRNIEIDKIKSSLIKVLEYTQPPIVHQLPDLLVFIIPDHSISITFQQDTILIADNSTNQIGAQIDKLLPLVIDIESHCKGDLFAYGYNYTLEATLEKKDTKVLQELLNANVLNNKNLIGETLISPEIKLRSKNNDYRNELTLTPHLTTDDKDTNLLSAQYNHHNIKDSLPEFSVLKTDYLARYDEFKSILNNLDE